MAIYRSPEFRRTRRALGTLMDSRTGVFESLGYTLWEYLHPEQVRAEYEAVGKDPATAVIPEFGDVIGAALEDTRDVAATGAQEIREGVTTLGSGAQKIAIAAAAGVGIYVAFRLMGRRRK